MMERDVAEKWKEKDIIKKNFDMNKGKRYFTFYAHLARIDVIKGQEVTQGSVIGIQGGDPKRDPNPGYSTGSHLHFEIRMSVSGDYLDPKDYLFDNKNV